MSETTFGSEFPNKTSESLKIIKKSTNKRTTDVDIERTLKCPTLSTNLILFKQ